MTITTTTTTAERSHTTSRRTRAARRTVTQTPTRRSLRCRRAAGQTNRQTTTVAPQTHHHQQQHHNHDDCTARRLAFGWLIGGIAWRNLLQAAAAATAPERSAVHRASKRFMACKRTHARTKRRQVVRGSAPHSTPLPCARSCVPSAIIAVLRRLSGELAAG